MRKILFCLLSIACMGHAGENLLWNSSFELGSAGYGGNRGSRYENNGQIRDPGPVAEIDAAAAAYGQNSLKLELKTNEQNTIWRFVTHEVALLPGKSYTFSFFAKSNAASTISFLCQSNQYAWQTVGSAAFNAGPEWKRHSMTLQVPDSPEKQKANDKFMMILAYSGDQTLWLDALQMEEGPLTHYQPQGAVECAVYMPSCLVEDDSLEAEIRAISYDSDFTGKFHGKLSAVPADKPFAVQELTMTLPQNKAKNGTMKFKNLPYGIFELTGLNGVQKNTVVRVRKPAAEYQPDRFQIGVISGCLEDIWPKWGAVDNTLYWRGQFGRPGAMAQMIRLSGSTWNDSWLSPVGRIGLLQPTPGQFAWDVVDLHLRLAAEAKLAPTFVIPAQSLLVSRQGQDEGHQVPQYIRRADRFGRPEGARLGPWENFKIVAPPAGLVADHIKAIVMRYPNKFVMIQLFAEFNGYMPVSMIREYAKLSQQAVRQYSPQTVFISMTPTGDFNGSVGGSYQEIIREKACDLTDAYGFHPYDSPMDDSVEPAHLAIRKLRSFLQKSGVEKPLWQTECYYLHKENYYNLRHPNMELYYAPDPGALVRRLAIDMGEGCHASSPLPYDAYFSNNHAPNNPRYPTGILVPNGFFAAQNAAGHFMNGAKALGVIEKNGILCYVFANRSKIFSILWSRDGRRTAEMQGAFKVYDLYGNPMAGTGNTLQLDRTPVYLEWQSAAPLEELKKSVFSGVNDFAASDLKWLNGTVGVRLRNESGSAVSGSVRLSSPYLQGQSLKFDPFEGEKEFRIPVVLKPGAPQEFPVKLITAGSRVSTLECTLKLNPVLENAQKYTFGGNNAFRVSYGSGKLVLDIFIPECKGLKGADVFASDSAEIFFDPLPLEGRIEEFKRYNDSTSQIVIPLYPNGESDIRILGKKLPVSFKRISPERLIVEFPAQPGVAGLNLAINNNGKHEAFSGQNNYCDRSGFAIITLEE
ncbi:MAG: Carbohydrate binding domain protein [Lentisphaerae bacterium ADurb.Bin242]|nr:MAG: Carbohydrate binding domain protein [Lentisphaerae bacterium ADurb.Bin242]